ncbi:MAG: hypothetical protein ACOCYE_13005, partial [Pseudomonadota bacterium]
RDFCPSLTATDFVPAEACTDDELVARFAKADAFVVAPLDDQPLPDEVQAKMQRVDACIHGNGVAHSRREQRHAALALIAALQIYYGDLAMIAAADIATPNGPVAVAVLAPLGGLGIDPITTR